MTIFGRTTLAMAIAAVATTAAVLSLVGAGAQGIAPQVTYQNIEDGDVIGGEKPYVVQLCFDREIDNTDLHMGGEFEFNLTNAQSLGFGMRIVFQPDGFGVAVYPGDSPAPIEGIPADNDWKFTYHVVDEETRNATDGEITFTVDPDAEPIPEATPDVCPPVGVTPNTQVAQVDSATPRDTRTPVDSGATSDPNASESPEVSPGEGETATATATAVAGEDDDDDDGPDIGTLALLTIGGAAILGIIAIVGYLIRQRVGYDPHKPGPPDDPSAHL